MAGTEVPGIGPGLGFGQKAEKLRDSLPNPPEPYESQTMLVNLQPSSPNPKTSKPTTFKDQGLHDKRLVPHGSHGSKLLTQLEILRLRQAACRIPLLTLGVLGSGLVWSLPMAKKGRRVLGEG